jgi:O-antigen ligase
MTTATTMAGATLVGFGAVLLVSMQATQIMPGLAAVPLALAACAVAALVLLLACAGSFGAILAYLAVLVFVNDALFRVREAGELGLDWQNAMKMALWAGAALIGVTNLGRAGPLMGRAGMVACLVYMVVALLSSIYSAAAVYSAATAFGMLAMLLFAVPATTRISERAMLLTCAWVLLLFIAISWVVYFVVPDLGRSPFITADNTLVERICGIAGQANALGHTVAVFLGVLFLLWYRGHARLTLLLPLAACGLVTLVAADSRSSLLGIMLAAGAVITRRSLWLWGSSIAALLGGVMVLLGVPARLLLGVTAGMSRSGDPTELFTLTGRTEIWDFVWDKIVLNPWLGYGYNASKYILPQFLGLGLQVDEAHNMLLQNMLCVGVVGTVPMLAVLVIMLVEYLRAPNPLRDFFYFFTIVSGVTEAGAFGSTPTLLTLMLFLGMVQGYTAAPAAANVWRPAVRPAAAASAVS